jgi:hypothetical protein
MKLSSDLLFYIGRFIIKLEKNDYKICFIWIERKKEINIEIYVLNNIINLKGIQESLLFRLCYSAIQ